MIGLLLHLIFFCLTLCCSMSFTISAKYHDSTEWQPLVKQDKLARLRHLTSLLVYVEFSLFYLVFPWRSFIFPCVYIVSYWGIIAKCLKTIYNFLYKKERKKEICCSCQKVTKIAIFKIYVLLFYLTENYGKYLKRPMNHAILQYHLSLDVWVF